MRIRSWVLPTHEAKMRIKIAEFRLFRIRGSSALSGALSFRRFLGMCGCRRPASCILLYIPPNDARGSQYLGMGVNCWLSPLNV